MSGHYFPIIAKMWAKIIMNIKNFAINWQLIGGNNNKSNFIQLE